LYIPSASKDTPQGKAVESAGFVFGGRGGCGGRIGFPVCKRKYKPFSSTNDVRVACHIHESSRRKRVDKEGVRDYEVFFKELMVKEGVDVRGIGGVGKMENDESKKVKGGMKGGKGAGIKRGVKRKSSSSSQFKVHDRVEALYLGLGTVPSDMYPGTVFRSNKDGTYDVKFDDGDRDRTVETHYIRRMEN
jgi:hypothetical protein